MDGKSAQDDCNQSKNSKEKAPSERSAKEKKISVGQRTQRMDGGAVEESFVVR